MRASYRTLSILLTLACLLLLVLMGWMILQKAQQTAAQAETAEPEQGETITEADSSLQGVSTLSGMPINSYDSAAFSTDGQFVTYSAAECTAGIDVSQHQGSIDWQAVAESGIDFAMIRVGYRGYSLGEISADAQGQENLAGATEAGLAVGVYFFSQAITVDEAIEEAKFVLEQLEGYTIQYPVVFDWEPVETGARTDGIDQETLTQCALAFCQTIEAAGDYQAAIYFNLSYGYQGYNLSKLLDYDFWLAEYTEIPSFVFHFDLWQYSCTGEIPGITGNVDLNLSFVDYGASED